MSGGQFDYIQLKLDEVVGELASLCFHNNIPNEYGFSNNFSKETLEEFERAVKAVRVARVYIQRIDWLVSGDDGEDSFHDRLEEDIKNVQNWR